MPTVPRQRATLKQLDPTRTSGLVKLYSRALGAKLDAIRKAIRQALVDRDVFGLKRGLLLHVIEMPPDKAWSAYDLPGKNRAFRIWLNDTLTKYFLEDVGLAADVTPQWIERFIRAAYTKGVTAALQAIGKTEPHVATLNVQALMNTPFHQERLAQLFDRNFTELKGFSASMSTNLQRILADGLVAGDNPRTMAGEIAQRLDMEKSRAVMIARTETIRVNASGQLGTFKRFGVAGVKLEAEWIISDLPNVCPECEDMAGKIFSIDEAEGMIPLHPN